jgi:hypothetical protein
LIAVDAAGRENDSREEGTAMVHCKVTVAVFVDLFPSPKLEHTIEVLMAEDPVAFWVGSISLKFMDDGTRVCTCQVRSLGRFSIF